MSWYLHIIKKDIPCKVIKCIHNLDRKHKTTKYRCTNDYYRIKIKRPWNSYVNPALFYSHNNQNQP